MSLTDNGMDTSSTPATPATAPNPSDLATFANLLAQNNQAFSQSVGHSLNATQQAIQDLAQITAQHNAEAQAVGGGLGAGGLDGEEGQGHHGHQIRVRAPDLFKGGSNDVERFIHDVEDCIELSQGVISTGRSKCLYMSRYIESPAWYHLVRTQHAELLDNFDGFIAAFRGHFDDPDKTTTSIRRLEALHQGRRTASQLYAEFVEIAQFVDISNDTKLSYFKRALADDTARQVAGSATVPTTFTEFAEFAIKVDNRLRAYEEDRHARTTDRSQRAHRVTIPHSTVMPAAPPTYSSSGTASNEPVPMDVDAVRVSRLTPDERRRRQTYGLCIYCGSSGHYRDTCPLLVSVEGASSATRGGGRGVGRGGV